MSASNDVLFRSSNVRVTSLLIRIGSTSIPVANVTSVSLRDPRGLTSCNAVGCILLALAVVRLFFCTTEHPSGRLALILLLASLVVFARATLTRQWLILHTAGTEWRALRGSDSALGDIKRAIERAIVARG